MKAKIYILLLSFSVLLGLKTIAQPLGWSHVLPITATNTTGSLVTNYQLKLTIDTQTPIAAAQMLANGDDIRFGKDCAGTTLFNYWIESGINTTTTTVWVKIDTLPASGAVTFYLFSGNASAAAASAVPGVFVGPHSSTDSVASGVAGGATSSQRGFRFAPNEDILLTHLGKREPTGTTRYVTLFDFVSQAIVSQIQVGGPAAQYSYGNVVSPLWLTSGTQYVLELYQGAADGYYFGTSSQIGQHLTYLDMRYCNSCTQNTFPTNVLSNYHYGYPDMWYFTKTTIASLPTVTFGTISSIGAVNTTSAAALSICSGSSTTLTATGTATLGWYDAITGGTYLGGGTSFTTGILTGNTTFYVQDSTSCGVSVRTAITVNVNALPSATSTSTPILCSGGTSTVTVVASGGTSPYVGEGTFTQSAGTAVYTVTDANGCAATSTETISEPSVLVVTSSSSPILCNGETSSVVISSTGGTPTYTGEGTFTQAAGTTVYTVTDANGCTGTTSVVVTEPAAIVTAQTATICAGQTVSVGTSNYTAPGTYTDILIAFNSCDSTVTTTVVVNTLPVVTATTTNSAICAGASVTLTGGGATTYAWDNSVTDGVAFTPTATTTYQVTGTDVNGCTNTATTTVTVNPLPIVTLTPFASAVCLQASAMTLTGGSPAGGVYSGTGVATGVFSPSVAGVGTFPITYTFTDVNSCTNTSTTNITVQDCTGINENLASSEISVYPNPAMNGMFNVAIDNANFETLYINIFNIQGKEIFSSVDKNVNGTFKKQITLDKVASGLYYIKFSNGSEVSVQKVTIQ